MSSETVRVTVNPHDMRFLRDRTGADNNQEVIEDALQFYKGAVLGAMNKESVAMVRQGEDGQWEVAQLELPKGRFAYAAGNADIPSLSRETVEKDFQKFIEDQRKNSGKGNLEGQTP